MKTILVTGAGRGLGLAITSGLCDAGYKVIAVSRSESPALVDLRAQTLAKNGLPLPFYQYDFEDTQNISKLVQQIISEQGPLFGLVNNAAAGNDGALATMHPSEISKLLRVNLEAPILLSKFVCRHLLAAGNGGRIVQISSVIASTGYSGLSVYAATKAGLQGFTRSLSRELGRANITVNCVAPGYMETDMTSALSAEQLEQVKRRAPLGLASTMDAAGAVLFLLSEAGARITGTTLTVDGGSTA